MKTSLFAKSVFALPLLSAALLLPGCSPNNAAPETAPTTPQAETTSMASSDATADKSSTMDASPAANKLSPASTAKTTTTKTTTTKTAPAKTTVATKTTTKADATPDPAYTVVDEGAQLPPQAADAIPFLKKVAMTPPPKNFPVPAKSRVTLQTSKGNIVLELDGKAAPLQVKSFLYLAQKGFFNGTQFHRYEPGFVIQGGDPLTRFPEARAFAGLGGPGYQIPREHNTLTHEKPFVLAAARTADPDSAGSQFYITLAPTPNLDAGDGYTVFGQVVTGSDVVLKLRADDGLKKVVVAGAAAQPKKK